ncbi:hypothetical protein F383_20382 [Gossypium arboreum]|uniref:Uncharacterized protein n=1 Tax=Gossypium arboreum TaxID=29729 RepID=A0A0B0NPA0_GOSAR|nr:hypothetical protein F383_20382 [Gossypium arboreum]
MVVVSPGVDLETKLVCSTWPHTWVCDLAVWHKSVYPTGLARPSTLPSTRPCVALFRAHGIVTRACVLAV